MFTIANARSAERRKPNRLDSASAAAQKVSKPLAAAEHADLLHLFAKLRAWAFPGKP